MSDNNKEYLAKRQLKGGTAGWVLLAGLLAKPWALLVVT